MPQFPTDTGLSSNRVVGWLISDGFEITIVENAPRPFAYPATASGSAV